MAEQTAKRDSNRIPTLLGVDSISYVDPTTAAVDPSTHRIFVDSKVSISGISLPQFDYVAMVISPATTETYTFKTGGSGGTTVATIVIVYTDSTRADISTVTKT
jgi:hypothetical protein